MAPVGAAVEHGRGHALAGEAVLPGLGELVGLGVEDPEPLELLEVRPLRRRRIAVGHVGAGVLPAQGRELGLRRPAVEQRIGIVERLAGLLELDQADRDDTLLAGQLGQRLHADAADHERAALARRGGVAVEQRLHRGGVARGGHQDWHLPGRSVLDLGGERIVELGLSRIGLGGHALGIGTPLLWRRRAHHGDDDHGHACEHGQAELERSSAHEFPSWNERGNGRLQGAGSRKCPAVYPEGTWLSTVRRSAAAEHPHVEHFAPEAALEERARHVRRAGDRHVCAARSTGPRAMRLTAAGRTAPWR